MTNEYDTMWLNAVLYDELEQAGTLSPFMRRIDPTPIPIVGSISGRYSTNAEPESHGLYEQTIGRGYRHGGKLKNYMTQLINSDYSAIERRIMEGFAEGDAAMTRTRCRFDEYWRRAFANSFVIDEAHYMKPRDKWEKALDYGAMYGLNSLTTGETEMPRKIAKLPALAMPYGRKLNTQAGKRRILGRLAYALVNSASPLAMGLALPPVKSPFAY